MSRPLIAGRAVSHRRAGFGVIDASASSLANRKVGLRAEPSAGRSSIAQAGTQETIVQVHGFGPTDLRFVNPEDDPRKKS